MKQHYRDIRKKLLIGFVSPLEDFDRKSPNCENFRFLLSTYICEFDALGELPEGPFIHGEKSDVGFGVFFLPSRFGTEVWPEKSAVWLCAVLFRHSTSAGTGADNEADNRPFGEVEAADKLSRRDGDGWAACWR
jgi:hypothetical protein